MRRWVVLVILLVILIGVTVGITGIKLDIFGLTIRLGTGKVGIYNIFSYKDILTDGRSHLEMVFMAVL
ncbi:hypothetical protein ACFLUF_02655, partial [Chloroflexota bacterium]